MIGSTVGKYRIVAKLGRGGMGTVYKAVDVTLDREVAVKILNPDVGDATLMARFRAEATTLARLNHPQIATIFEIYQSDTDLLMVMELVRGETLEHLSVRCGPLPPEHAAYLLVQMLGALSHAHRAGIVHRDLKPANVMVTEAGTVKVMDFGIARVLGAEHLTMDGMLMGTPAYMAPEQVLGKDVDARTDLYSAGVMLYRMLTGCLPFQADSPVAIIHKTVWEAPTAAREHRGDLPEWCDSVLDRALQKAPEARFQSAEEFRSAIVSGVGQSNAPSGVRFEDYPPNPLTLANFPSRPAPGAESVVIPVPPAPPSQPAVPADEGATVTMPTVAGGLDLTMVAWETQKPPASLSAPPAVPAKAPSAPAAAAAKAPAAPSSVKPAAVTAAPGTKAGSTVSS
ncbi:MAG: serine/threonine-protein kinase, partial [Vicinamibacterales bacterium]